MGESEAAIDEIIETISPDVVVVETTGVAEPDALAFDVQESLPQVRLDGIITVMDADGMVQFPRLGRKTRVQLDIEPVTLLIILDFNANTVVAQMGNDRRHTIRGDDHLEISKAPPSHPARISQSPGPIE